MGVSRYGDYKEGGLSDGGGGDRLGPTDNSEWRDCHQDRGARDKARGVEGSADTEPGRCYPTEGRAGHDKAYAWTCRDDTCL